MRMTQADGTCFIEKIFEVPGASELKVVNSPTPYKKATQSTSQIIPFLPIRFDSENANILISCQMAQFYTNRCRIPNTHVDDATEDISIASKEHSMPCWQRKISFFRPLWDDIAAGNGVKVCRITQLAGCRS